MLSRFKKRGSSDGQAASCRRSRLRTGQRLLVAFFIFHFSFLTCTAQQGAWRKQPSGTLAWLHGVYFVDAERGWAVGGSGVVLSTTDGGAHWKALRRPTEDILRDVYFADAATGWLVCDRNIHKIQTKDEPRSYLLKTSDGGATWRRVEATGADVETRIVRLIFADRERGWVFGEAGALYATGDGGATWTRQRVPTRHLLLGGAFLDAQQGWLVGAGATVLATGDGGATWRESRVETPAINVSGSQSSPSSVGSPSVAARARASFVPAARLRAVSFVNPRRGWAVGDGGRIFSTKDGGRTWRAQTTEATGNLLDVKFFDESEGWAVGDGGLMLHTGDGGATWRVVASGTTHPLERIFFSSRTRGWAVGFGGTIVTLGTDADTAPPRLKAAG